MKLATIGSNCIDFYKNMDGGTAFAGGGPVNMAVYAKRLGHDSSYIGMVGNDEYGKIMKNSISKFGVDTSHLHTVPGKTAVTQVELDNGERVFGDYDEGVLVNNILFDEDINFIGKHDAVVCDLWGNVENQIKDLHDLGIKTAFDCATEPDNNASLIAIPHSDYIFFSYDKEDMIYVKDKLRKIHSQGPEIVVAMLGEKGSICFDGNKFYEFGIIKCDKVIDTMGAGDSYIAGFLTSIVSGLSIEQAMYNGAKTASDTIKYFGAW